MVFSCSTNLSFSRQRIQPSWCFESEVLHRTAMNLRSRKILPTPPTPVVDINSSTEFTAPPAITSSLILSPISELSNVNTRVLASSRQRLTAVPPVSAPGAEVAVRTTFIATLPAVVAVPPAAPVVASTAIPASSRKRRHCKGNPYNDTKMRFYRNDDFEVVIVDMSLSDLTMSAEKIELVRNSLNDACLEHQEDVGFYPIFRYAGLTNGRFRVVCGDAKSRDWLTEFLPSINPPWEGADLKVMSSCEVGFMPRVSVFLPYHRKLSENAIVTNLVGKNKQSGLQLDKWQLIVCDWVDRRGVDRRGRKSSGHFCIFRLPQTSLDLLFRCRPSIYWMMQKVTVKQFGVKSEDGIKREHDVGTTSYY